MNTKVIFYIPNDHNPKTFEVSLPGSAILTKLQLLTKGEPRVDPFVEGML